MSFERRLMELLDLHDDQLVVILEYVSSYTRSKICVVSKRFLTVARRIADWWMREYMGTNAAKYSKGCGPGHELNWMRSIVINGDCHNHVLQKCSLVHSDLIAGTSCDKMREWMIKKSVGSQRKVTKRSIEIQTMLCKIASQLENNGSLDKNTSRRWQTYKAQKRNCPKWDLGLIHVTDSNMQTITNLYIEAVGGDSITYDDIMHLIASGNTIIVEKMFSKIDQWMNDYCDDLLVLACQSGNLHMVQFAVKIARTFQPGDEDNEDEEYRAIASKYTDRAMCEVRGSAIIRAKKEAAIRGWAHIIGYLEDIKICEC